MEAKCQRIFRFDSGFIFMGFDCGLLQDWLWICQNLVNFVTSWMVLQTKYEFVKRGQKHTNLWEIGAKLIALVIFVQSRPNFDQNFLISTYSALIPAWLAPTLPAPRCPVLITGVVSGGTKCEEVWGPDIYSY